MLTDKPQLRPTSEPGLSSKIKVLVSSLRVELEILWAPALALLWVVLIVAVFRGVFDFPDEKLEWTVYLTLGTIFPLSLLLSTPQTSFFRLKLPFEIFKLVIIAVGIVYAFIALPQEGQYSSFVFSAAHVLLLAFLFRKTDLPVKPGAILVCLLVIVVSWTLSVRFLWWSFFSSWIYMTDNRTGILYRFFVCGFALVLVSMNLVHKGISEAGLRFRFWSVPNIAAVLIFALAGFGSDRFFDLGWAYSHWGVIVGPAEMVRQGGWLLWDTPAQYGFLSTLTVAYLPFKTVWQSLYVINSCLLILTGVFLFFILRSLRTGRTNFIFSLMVTLAAIFLLPGYLQAGYSPQVFPMLGPFRFGWCYALLALLFWELRTGSGRPKRWIFILGNILWLLGTLWSSESAAYCSAVWLPAYALLVLRVILPAYRNEKSVKEVIRKGALWLALPVLMLVSAVGLIAIFYLRSLGHGPDWSAYYEYSVASIGGFLAMPTGLDTPVLTLFLIFCLVSTVVAHFLRRGLTARPLSLAAGTWGALWAINSYYVSRSHSNNANALTPILCLSIALSLYLLVRYQLRGWWAMSMRMGFVPFLTIILIMTFGNTVFLAPYILARRVGYQRDITINLPQLDVSLVELLKSAGVNPGDPIIYRARGLYSIKPSSDGYSPDHAVIFPVWPAEGGSLNTPARRWLPTAPFQVLAPLPEHRRQEYMSRFADRARLSGWLVQSKHEPPYETSQWFYEQVMRTHAPTRLYENNDWQLTWFEHRPESNALR